MITLILLSGLLLTGGIVMLLEIWNAPEGFQDRDGFHVIWKNNSPETRDVSAVWAGLSELVVAH